MVIRPDWKAPSSSYPEGQRTGPHMLGLAWSCTHGQVVWDGGLGNGEKRVPKGRVAGHERSRGVALEFPGKPSFEPHWLSWCFHTGMHAERPRIIAINTPQATLDRLKWSPSLFNSSTYTYLYLIPPPMLCLDYNNWKDITDLYSVFKKDKAKCIKIRGNAQHVRAHPLFCLTSLPYPQLLPPAQGCLVLEQSLRLVNTTRAPSVCSLRTSSANGGAWFVLMLSMHCDFHNYSPVSPQNTRCLTSLQIS